MDDNKEQNELKHLAHNYTPYHGSGGTTTQVSSDDDKETTANMVLVNLMKRKNDLIRSEILRTIYEGTGDGDDYVVRGTKARKLLDSISYSNGECYLMREVYATDEDYEEIMLWPEEEALKIAYEILHWLTLHTPDSKAKYEKENPGCNIAHGEMASGITQSTCPFCVRETLHKQISCVMCGYGKRNGICVRQYSRIRFLSTIININDAITTESYIAIRDEMERDLSVIYATRFPEHRDRICKPRYRPLEAKDLDSVMGKVIERTLSSGYTVMHTLSSAVVDKDGKLLSIASISMKDLETEGWVFRDTHEPVAVKIITGEK